MSRTYDFDREIDRTGTSSVKWSRYKDRNILPLWVADTDFACPPEVLDTLHARVDHGVFGYTLPPRELIDTVLAHLEKAYNWKVDPAWGVWLPGLVSGLAVCSRAFAEPGESVLTSTPIYPPFLACPTTMDRNLQTAPLTSDSDRWTFDWDALAAAADPTTRLYLFCSPHNPCGRIWERSELEKLGEFCAERDIVICSDEIHNQLLLDGRPHIPTAAVSPEIADRTITLMAPSKTYNIAGLACSFAIIPNPELRKKFESAAAMIVPHINALGFTAALAAYQHGGPWLDAQLNYLREARDMIETTVAAIPRVSMTHVEATFLAWLDCRELGLDKTAKYFEDYGLGFQAGREFGLKGFVRWNFGTTHARTREAIARFQRGCAAVG